jgi:hypothetical protein
MLDPSTPKRLAAASIDLTEETAQRLVSVLEHAQNRTPLARIRNSQIVSALVGTVGLALFIVGVENAASDLPVLSNAYASILGGLSLLAITGLALRTLAGHGMPADREPSRNEESPGGAP